MPHLTIGGIRYPFQALRTVTAPAQAPHYVRQTLAVARQWFDGGQTFTLRTSGSTGPPKPITLHRRQMIASAQMTGKALGLQSGNNALVCLAPHYIAGLMMLVRGFVLGLNLTVVAPKGNPLSEFPPETHFDFTALVPLQLDQILQDRPSKKVIVDDMRAILVGGAAVSQRLQQALQSIAAPVYHTYGMTETVTHIALKRLNGSHPDNAFQPLPGVNLSLDSRGCLVITAPSLNQQPVITNDRVALQEDGSFIWLGRIDNVVNSGGVKIQVEQVTQTVEAVLAEFADGANARQRFVIGGVPDTQLGESLVMVIEGETWSANQVEGLKSILQEKLPRYHAPRRIAFMVQFPQTQTGKIDRQTVMALLQFPDT